MNFRNIHVRAPQPLNPSTAQPSLPRLRGVTNDPAREYAARPGAVEKLPDSVAALILCKQGFNKVGRNGIAIELDGRKLKYWSENSVTIATRAGTNEKVLWTVNRQQPDVLHILTSDGEYVESIPLDGKVPWFDEAATAKILGAKKRANQRRMDRVRFLHAPDAQAALERETHNEGQLRGLVQTFPRGDLDDETTFPTSDRAASQPRVERIDPNSRQIARRAPLSSSPVTGHRSPSFPRASRLHDIQRSLGEQRAAFEADARAARFGATVNRHNQPEQAGASEQLGVIEEW